MDLPSRWVQRRLRRQAVAWRSGADRQSCSRAFGTCPFWAHACDDLQDLMATCLAAIEELGEVAVHAGARARGDAANPEDDMAQLSEDIKAMAPTVAAATAKFQKEMGTPAPAFQLHLLGRRPAEPAGPGRK